MAIPRPNPDMIVITYLPSDMTAEQKQRLLDKFPKFLVEADVARPLTWDDIKRVFLEGWRASGSTTAEYAERLRKLRHELGFEEPKPNGD